MFQAIKAAIAAAREDGGVEGRFTLNSPATAETIRLACSDKLMAQVWRRNSRIGSARSSSCSIRNATGSKAGGIIIIVIIIIIIIIIFFIFIIIIIIIIELVQVVTVLLLVSLLLLL